MIMVQELFLASKAGCKGALLCCHWSGWAAEQSCRVLDCKAGKVGVERRNVRPSSMVQESYSLLAKPAAKGHCVTTSVGLGESALPQHLTAWCSKGIFSSLAKPV